MKFTFPFSISYKKDNPAILPLTSLWVYRVATWCVIAQSIIGVTIILFNYRHLPPLLPLWYSKPWGEERLASPYFLFIIPVSGLCVYLINIWVVKIIHLMHPIYARVLLLISAVVSCISMSIVIGILRLVI